ncbi:MAG: flagellar hook assembly protein FlgD [Labilithrix sp.]|nr:flagellar hook assembly protein FlgD [Labilithrix sp.]
MGNPISQVGAPGNTTGVGAASNAGAKQLDRDAFLKLLVAQISHQDPLKPMEGTEFVSQLSQFAMVEQSIAQSARLDDMKAQLLGIANSDATSLVGKRVTMRGQTMSFDGITATTSAATLDGPAAKVAVEVVDATGSVVRTIELGPRPAGAFQVTWDGKDARGEAAPKGTYTLRVKAQTADGVPVSCTQDVTGTVTKVTFDKGYPELTLDTGSSGPISDLVGVVAPPPAEGTTR